MNKKKIAALGAGLALLLALTAAYGLGAERRARAAQEKLGEIYEGAVLSAMRQMDDMELLLSKALLSEDAGQCAQYLSQVSAGAAQAQQSLTLLPLAHDAAARAVKLANQLSDYARTLIEAGTLTEEDARQLETLTAACAQYTAALYQARDSLARQAGETAAPAASEEETKSYDTAVSYPTLIYDGPFSDARETGPALALGEQEITREEARQIAREFVGTERVRALQDGADMGGNIPCYGVTAALEDVTLELAVSKRGGKVLWMAPDAANFTPEKSLEECREEALLFLESRGYADMRPTYFQVYEGVAVISFAATQGETLLYPDLVKVQLRMDKAEVVGLEARHYLQNHTARGPLLPLLTPEEAQGAVSARLTISGRQLCLIPTQAGERLCYEFQGTYGGASYLCYINAETGKQEELLKIVESSAGLETA